MKFSSSTTTSPSTTTKSSKDLRDDFGCCLCRFMTKSAAKIGPRVLAACRSQSDDLRFYEANIEEVPIFRHFLVFITAWSTRNH